MTEPLTPGFDSELVVGLVGAVGAELEQVVTLLDERIKRAGYAVEVITISSDVIAKIANAPISSESKFDRISSLMTAGNVARERANDDAILAYGASSIIFANRSREVESLPAPPRQKVAYIIKSLKRPEEVDALRFIYPQGFVLVGVHADLARRLAHLEHDVGMSKDQAIELVRRDDEESRVPHGQRVKRTFHLADFFVQITGDGDQLRNEIRRMVEIWFGHPYITPTFDEYAMYFAFAAAMRSADLSRQVGAVLTRKNQILASGANECPAAGGGQYWPKANASDEETRDFANGRDYRRGVDSNRVEQLRIIQDIVEKGSKPDYGFSPEKLTKLLKESRILDLTEYGRVVHAEMEAILACCRTGISTIDADLHCTTFPCHNCAKHIIAAGIKRVVYIEPYAKSKALEFHDEAITTDNLIPGENKVKFEPFVGIGPRRFFDLFSMQLGTGYELIRKNKETGKRMHWVANEAKLRIQMNPNSYLDHEVLASKRFSAFQDTLESGTENQK